MKQTLKVAVTGAAGQISYSVLFRLAAGELAGRDTPIDLRLLEVPQAMDKLRGVEMELHDCAFGSLQSVSCHSDARECFDDIDAAFLIGARPRGPGMERADLLGANAEIFKKQGRALDAGAKADAKVLVVGNPANTNALITLSHARKLDPVNVQAMMCLDLNRARSMLAQKLTLGVSSVRRMIVWGNHSTTQYPDVEHVQADGQALSDHAVVSADPSKFASWLADEFRPRVQKRGAEIIQARGSSSAASAASAAIDHMRAVLFGHDDWLSAGRLARGAYGIDDDIVFGLPFDCPGNGVIKLVDGLEFSDIGREKFAATLAELRSERDAVTSYID
ncbi:MAG: malate dehydrogenase [Proteobacteria bacterium]|nr:malate dehydrogenase [Pseudomonadota bacterium]